MHHPLEPQGRQSVPQVVGAVVMEAKGAELLVAIAVARRNQRVVDPRRGVLDHGQNHPALVGIQAVADLRCQAAQHAAGVFHGHALAQIRIVKGPEVHHLRAVGVDDPHHLPSLHPGGAALAGGNQVEVLHRCGAVGQRPGLFQALVSGFSL